MIRMRKILHAFVALTLLSIAVVAAPAEKGSEQKAREWYASQPWLVGWGTSFLDFDNDGWQDLFVVNGHVYPLVDAHQWGTSYAQQALLFRNIKGKFERVGARPSNLLFTERHDAALWFRRRDEGR